MNSYFSGIFRRLFTSVCGFQKETVVENSPTEVPNLYDEEKKEPEIELTVPTLELNATLYESTIVEEILNEIENHYEIQDRHDEYTDYENVEFEDEW
jgi:hypothetical protein